MIKIKNLTCPEDILLLCNSKITFLVNRFVEGFQPSEDDLWGVATILKEVKEDLDNARDLLLKNKKKKVSAGRTDKK